VPSCRASVGCDVKSSQPGEGRGGWMSLRSVDGISRLDYVMGNAISKGPD
jgi:hypothetical protein